MIPQIRSSEMLPRHTYETEVIREQQNPFSKMFLGFSLMPQERRIIRIDHSIDQDGHPDSYVGLTFDSDGITPNVHVFVYLVPLQLSHALIVGALIQPLGVNEWKGITNKTSIFSLAEADKGKARAMIDTCVKMVHDRYERETTKTVEYLEWERRQMQSSE